MFIWHSFMEAASALCGRATAITIGTFDGVHLGHRAVIGELCRGSKERSLLSLVMTFAQHPDSIVLGEAPPLLLPLARRLELLAELGVEATLVLAFDDTIAALAPEAFVKEKLHGDLGARLVVAGHDFRFGARGSGDAGLLVSLGQQWGFETIQVPPVVVDGTAISSTAIRWMLAAGDVAAANRYLGYPYAVRGIVARGQRRGHRLGFPTANITLAPGALWPRYGVYLVEIKMGGLSYHGVANVGIKPTFGADNEPAVEVYLFSYEGDLYHASMDVSFLAFIRPERWFPDAGALRARIAADIEAAKAMLT